MPKKRTCVIELHCKEPDTFGDLASELKLSEAKRDRFLEFGEYARIELEIDADMNVVGGKFLPYK